MTEDWQLPEEEIHKQIARVSIERAHQKESTDMATEKKEKGGVIKEINDKLAAKKKDEEPKRLVQTELIEDARQVKALPRKLRNLLQPLCVAEEAAGANRLRANELLGEIQSIMADQEIPEVALPNGGKVIYTEKKAARYVAPKKKKKASADDEDEDADE